MNPIQHQEYVISPPAPAPSPKSPLYYGVNPCFGVSPSHVMP